MIIAGTGHRPNKLGGYDYRIADDLRDMAQIHLTRWQPDKVISGMALGWDIALARAAIFAKIPLIAAVPFAGQDKMWPKKDRDQYTAILQLAAEVMVVSPGGYKGWKMWKRNQWMVDQLKEDDDQLLALWDGSSGGTANCIEYARGQNKTIENGKVVNLWGVWRKQWTGNSLSQP